MLIRFYYVNLETKVSLDLKERLGTKKEVTARSRRTQFKKNVSSKTSNKLYYNNRTWH